MCHEESNHRKAPAGVYSVMPSNRRQSSSRGRTHSVNRTTASTISNAPPSIDGNIPVGIVPVSWPGLLHTPRTYKQLRNATRRNSWQAVAADSSTVAGWRRIPKQHGSAGATTTRNATRKTPHTSTTALSNDVHGIWLHRGNSPDKMPRGSCDVFATAASTVLKEHRRSITSRRSSTAAQTIPGTSVPRVATATPKRVLYLHYNSSQPAHCVMPRDNTC